MAIVTISILGSLGRFGNQIFQVASVIGIADRNKKDFLFPRWINKDHLERFGSTEDVEIYKHLVNDLPELQGTYGFRDRWINWGYEPVLLGDGNWDLSGHMQSIKYFEHCIDKVRYHLTFKGEPEYNDYVAVHYRAGDYQQGGHSYHPRCDKEYYEKAFGAFSGRKFLVFSDDLTEAMSVMPSGYNVEFMSGDYLSNFKLMKKCHSFIVANSSFSLAAAILSDQPGKKIVAPRRWFGTAANGLPTEDLYPHDAIVI